MRKNNPRAEAFRQREAVTGCKPSQGTRRGIRFQAAGMKRARARA